MSSMADSHEETPTEDGAEAVASTNEEPGDTRTDGHEDQGVATPDTNGECPSADLESAPLETLWSQPVLLVSIVVTILLLHEVNYELFDRLQYEDSYIENLTVIGLIIGLAGMVPRCLALWRERAASKDDRMRLWVLLVFLQLLFLSAVAFYAAAQELEFGQRALGYDPPEDVKEETGIGMNLHNLVFMEVAIAIGAVIVVFYTVVLPYMARSPWSDRLPPPLRGLLYPWLLKLPRSLVPAFGTGTFFTLLQNISLVLGNELEQFNEWAEVCFAMGFALLGVYLLIADRMEPTLNPDAVERLKEREQEGSISVDDFGKQYGLDR